MAHKDSHYKLTYFNLRGIAEPVRQLFAYANVPYEDVRLDRENWANSSQKQESPFHQLPFLEVDGHTIGQSNAILRFVGKRLNLAGKDEFEQARVDALADYATDMRSPLSAWFFEQDETRKKAMKEKYFNETLPGFLKTYEQHLKSNGGQFFVGSGPTWADFVIAHGMGQLQVVEPNALNGYELLKAHEQRINNLQGVKEWISKRPKTPM
ncbi:glutathione S-transferase 1-like [Paramacrobiotus metropolitanus]|uniref:glutathione S-transferase 1-like n=1 Tax=Paramacrobiotus metropolitanus TaxID=2943436 RepID=UPI0024457BA4|nr:glutathione S-transferase 1-like [Paramacrobiotus metropolitanus]